MARKPTNSRSLREACYYLASLWFVFGGLITLINIIMTMTGKYKGIDREVWSWALSLFMPTLGLIVSVLGPTAVFDIGAVVDRRKVDHRFFRLTVGVSFFYLLLILMVILTERIWTEDFPEVITTSNYWFSPLQGLVTALMGFLFVFSNDPDQSVRTPPLKAMPQTKGNDQPTRQKNAGKTARKTATKPSDNTAPGSEAPADGVN